MTEDAGCTSGPQPRWNGMAGVLVGGTDRWVVGAVGAVMPASLLLAVEPHAALTRSTAATATPCATRNADLDHIRHNSFRAHRQEARVVAVHDTCRAVCAVKQDYPNVLRSWVG